MYRLPFGRALMSSIDFFLPTDIGSVLPGKTTVSFKGSIGIDSGNSFSSIVISPIVNSPVMNDIFPSTSLSLALFILNGFILIFFLFIRTKYLVYLFTRIVVGIAQNPCQSKFKGTE